VTSRVESPNSPRLHASDVDAATAAAASGGESVDPSGKGIGLAPDGTALADVARLGWQLLREDLSLPAAVLYRDIVDHNLAWMKRFVEAYAVALAPHGKTTMCPKIFAWQIENGAWGITLATASQMRAAARHGVRRVLMANQLVGQRNMAIVSELLRDPAFEAYVLVDSADNVDQLGRFFRASGQRIAVLLELGAEGGRTGVRDEAGEAAVLAAIDRWSDAVTLAGVEVYEGVLPTEAAIRALLQRAVATVERYAQAGRFAKNRPDRPVILSGAGSAWFDVVADELVKASIGAPLQVVLRPGCYVTHDVGSYREAQARMEAANPTVQRLGVGDGLRPAMHIWACVQSRPEPTLAIVGLGKRDVAFDSGMPAPALRFRPATVAARAAGAGAASGAEERPSTAPKEWPSAAPKEWIVTRMMDQHAYMTVPADADLRIGDMIAFDISHPCLTWDKWRQVAVLDRDYRVVDLLQTYF
jgi:D-serine dehydratase